MMTINKHMSSTYYVPFWKTCVGAGRANEGLRTNFHSQLTVIQKNIHFRYLRFHGLLHDDMFVLRRDEQGNLLYNFQYIDELFDEMLNLDIRPFVELGFFPSCIKGGDETQFWWKGNVTPPAHWDDWSDLVAHLIRHWLSRYGADQVHQWYFEVWNEPNLHGFWDGTKSQYFAMYAATVQTIKAIDPALRVGGPATSNFVPDARFDGEIENAHLHITHKVDHLDSLEWHGVWIEDFLSFCIQKKLPVDFVSTHPYPTDFAIDSTGKASDRSRGIDATQHDLRWLQNVVRNSGYPQAEIHLTEWSSSPSSRDCTHDYLQEAAFIVKCNLDCIGLADSLSYWTFTDVFEENGAGDSIFHGGFGLINFQGIVKPSFHAYRMLANLGDELLFRDEHAFFTCKDNRLSAILYNYPISSAVCMSPYPNRNLAHVESEKGETQNFCYRIEGLMPGTIVHLETLDHTHGWALPVWQKMGSPEPPTREQTNELRAAALALDVRELIADERGIVQLDIALTPWSVSLLTELG